MILPMACCMSGFIPGNQFPYPECKLYARSSAIRTPVGDG